MNNQYMPKYVKVKQIKRPDGTVCYLEKDHINAIEDTLLYEEQHIGRRDEPVGQDLTTILNHIADDAIKAENRIDNISRNNITLPIDSNKKVDIVVHDNLNELIEDSDHRTVKDSEKQTWNNKQDIIIFQSGNYDKDTNKAITKSDLDTAVEPLSKATKWRGVFATLADVPNPQHADVVSLQNGKEYVYSTQSGTGEWIEFGDTSNCIKHGEVKNNDVKDDAAISQSKIAGLTTDLEKKVDKVNGKSLVLDTDIVKIHDHDNKNVLDSIDQQTWNDVVAVVNKVEGKVDKTQKICDITLQGDITKTNLLSALNVEDGANVNKIEKIEVNGVEQTITNKCVNITIAQAPSEATSAEVQTGTANNKMVTPNKTAESVKFGLLHNADKTSGGTDLASTDQKKVQTWLGTNQLIFTFNDNTTKTFNFVCNEVI